MKKKLSFLFPILDWTDGYSSDTFRADFVAGVVVLFITVPQVIAYAFLAGLPPEAGLYAALGSLIIYSLAGSSRTLAVGPTAIIAMMTLEVASSFAAPGSGDYISVTIKLGFITGILLLLLRLLNFGNVISFLSHAVVTGFITAAAILIVASQLPPLLGLSTSSDTRLIGVFSHLGTHTANIAALVISLLAFLILIFCRLRLESYLLRLRFSKSWASALTKTAPMYIVILGIIVTSLFNLNGTYGLPIVGPVPSGLPSVSLVSLSLAEFRDLLPSALLIAMVIFMESISIGTAMASKRREKILPNQELVGLGLANIGASSFGGFPVAGSFSRTVVNFASGARTPMASIVTAVFLVLAICFFSSMFYFLPKAILSAIIVISALQLIDFSALRKIFIFNSSDAVTFCFTFLAVLIVGVESGIIIGVVISFVLLIRSSSRPHIAVVGRVGGSEHFRNVLRHQVATSSSLLAVRIDESLYFVNARYIETFFLNELADRPDVQNLLMIFTATNFIDTSGLEMIEALSENLEEIGVTLHLAEVKGPVMDKLRETDFYRRMKGEVFFTTDEAFQKLGGI
ncbi:MAG: SulP family inorganic anion transporter [Candidatus Azotimanducaceae bacterium]|nr:sodium-independent anion transporter [Gammaproteobacteria bacterium]OUV68123.1 MAG: hypothetical protein CBC93_01995 [Gammaproteobacteria bacterium TMED133]